MDRTICEIFTPKLRNLKWIAKLFTIFFLFCFIGPSVRYLICEITFKDKPINVPFNLRFPALSGCGFTDPEHQLFTINLLGNYF